MKVGRFTAWYDAGMPAFWHVVLRQGCWRKRVAGITCRLFIPRYTARTRRSAYHSAASLLAGAAIVERRFLQTYRSCVTLAGELGQKKAYNNIV